MANIIKLIPLKGYNVFSEIYEKGQKFHNKSAFLAAEIVTQPEDSKKYIVEFGVTISKRNAKKAVVRNRVKRLLRVSIREYFKALDSETNLKIISSGLGRFYISWKYAPKHPMLIKLSDVEPLINELLNRLISSLDRNKKLLDE